MLDRIFPKQELNNYQGKTIARWVFIAIVIMSIARSLAHILLPDGGAQSIATIPLDEFTESGALVVIGMFAQWGLTQLLFSLLYVIVLWRYQSLIPLMWIFIFFEWAGRLIVGYIKPLETVATAPGAIGNLLIPLLALIMFALSLPPGKQSQE